MSVIYFKSEKPYRQLVEKGYVFTFRLKKRRTGYAWVKRSRKGEKKFLVYVELFDELKEGEDIQLFLHRYVSNSGFLTVTEWLNEIMKINRLKKPPKSGYMYSVVRVIGLVKGEWIP